MTQRFKLAVLGSTRGTNLIPLQSELLRRKIPAKIELVLSHRADSGILGRAREMNCRAIHLPDAHASREALDGAISAALKAAKIDCVVLMGYMRILSSVMVDAWRHKILNVHPSLLPAFSGLMDRAIHQAVLAAGFSETGCTVHEVTETLDGGPILIQKTCQVHVNDTVDSLKKRVQRLEVEALADAILIGIDEKQYGFTN